MANIGKFTPANLDLVRAAMEKALSDVEKSFGIRIDIGKMTYTEDGTAFKAPLNAAVKSSNPYLADVAPKLQQDLVKYFDYKDALGRTIEDRGVKYVVVGKNGKNYIVKKEGKPEGGMFKIPVVYGDKIDCQVRGVTYDPANDLSRIPVFKV